MPVNLFARDLVSRMWRRKATPLARVELEGRKPQRGAEAKYEAKTRVPKRR